MDLIILPGNSVNSKIEMNRISNNICQLFDRVYIHNYRHWRKNQKIIDINYETDALRRKLKSKQNIVIFAKSVGIVLALKIIMKNGIEPKGVIFAGLPIYWLDDKKIKIEKILRNLNTKSLFIQKKRDPFFPSNNLRMLLNEYKVSNYSMVEVEGENHNYNLTNIFDICEEFIMSLGVKNILSD